MHIRRRKSDDADVLIYISQAKSSGDEATSPNGCARDIQENIARIVYDLHEECCSSPRRHSLLDLGKAVELARNERSFDHLQNPGSAKSLRSATRAISSSLFP